jgi:hypothetical protein
LSKMLFVLISEESVCGVSLCSEMGALSAGLLSHAVKNKMSMKIKEWFHIKLSLLSDCGLAPGASPTAAVF